jgi:hypothetical protein
MTAHVKQDPKAVSLNRRVLTWRKYHEEAYCCSRVGHADCRADVRSLSCAKRRRPLIPGVKARPRSNGPCRRRRRSISSIVCRGSSAQVLESHALNRGRNLARQCLGQRERRHRSHRSHRERVRARTRRQLCESYAVCRRPANCRRVSLLPERTLNPIAFARFLRPRSRWRSCE